MACRCSPISKINQRTSKLTVHIGSNPRHRHFICKVSTTGSIAPAAACTRLLTRLSQAIVADSDYAEAYEGLAASYDLMPEYSLMPQEEAFSRAIAAANKAVSLNPSLSIAHRALAFALFWSQTDIPRAFSEFQESVRLAPDDAEAHHWYATALNSVVRIADARREIDIAQQLSPASRSILADQTGFTPAQATRRPLQNCGKSKPRSRTSEVRQSFLPASTSQMGTIPISSNNFIVWPQCPGVLLIFSLATLRKRVEKSGAAWLCCAL